MDTPPIKIRTLGRFAIEIGGSPLRFKGKSPVKPLELLKVLIAMGGQDVATERLEESLWPDSDGDRAHSAFSTNLARLRKLLLPEALVVQDNRLTLDDRICWVDSQAFAEALGDSTALLSDGWDESAWLYIEAMLDFYRGPFLEGEFDPPEILSTRERLHGQLLRHLEKVGTLLQEHGDLKRAVEIFQRGLDADDLAEEMYRNLMQCYLDQGRYVEGVAVYQRCKNIFQASVGIDPSRDTEALYQKLMEHQNTPEEPVTDFKKEIPEPRPQLTVLPAPSPPSQSHEQVPEAPGAFDAPRNLSMPRDMRMEPEAHSPPFPSGPTGTVEAADTGDTHQKEPHLEAPTPPNKLTEPKGEPEKFPHLVMDEDPGERRIATVAFIDLSGYTRLGEILDPEELVEYMGWIRREASRIIELHGGRINQYLGDGVLALFGAPTAHEDDPIRAVRAALDLNQVMRTKPPPLENSIGFPVRLHMGINTGLVVTNPEKYRAEDMAVTGNAVNIAARLADLAAPEEILIGPQTKVAVEAYFNIEGLEPVVLKGTSQPVIPFRVTGISSVQTRLQAAAVQGLSAFTGREAELQQLKTRLKQARAGEGQLVNVVGDPGLGKSRLLHEFMEGLDREQFTVLECHAQAYGQDRAYMPFREGLRRGLGIRTGMSPQEMSERLLENIQNRVPELEPFIPYYLSLLSLPNDQFPLPPKMSSEELRLAYQNALAALCIQGTHHRPIMLILEDWQWADDASVATLNMVVGLMSSHPLLLIVTSRPEFKPDWGHPSYHTLIPLRPLDQDQTGHLLHAILNARAIPGTLVQLAHERSGGNPFFIEEMCHAFLEDGTLKNEDGRIVLTRPLEEVALPNSVQAIIRTRVDRLDENDRNALRLAAVIGREFRLPVMEQIFSLKVDLEACLTRLTRLELLQQTAVLPEPRYRFKHILTQVVVYETMLLQQRRKLHEVIGHTLERVYADQLDQWLESLAYHFNRSNAAEKAIDYLKRAGEKAANFYSLENARGFYRAVLKRLESIESSPQCKAEYIEISLKWAAVSYYAPTHEHLEVIERARWFAGELNDLDLLMRTTYWTGRLLSVFGYTRKAISTYEEALALGKKHDHPEIVARTINSLGRICAHTGEYKKGVEYLEQGIPMMLELGDLAEWTFSRRFMGRLLATMGRFREAETLMTNAIEKAQAIGNLTQQAGGMADLAWVCVLKGDWDEALVYSERAMALARETDNHQIVRQCLVIKGNCLFNKGEREQGLDFMRQGIPATDFPLPVGAITFLAWLIENQALMGDLETARKGILNLELIRQHAEAGSGDITTNRARAQLSAQETPPDESAMRASMESAISIAREREAMPDLAISYYHLGRLLHGLGHSDEARTMLEEARTRFEEMGMKNWPGHAQALLAQLPKT